MSNLGLYQTMTSIAKKVGGSIQLLTIVAGGGVLICGSAVAGGNAIKKKITAKMIKKKQAEKAAIVYTVNTEGKSNEGLLFKAGEKFRVLETNGKAGLIEKIGDDNNPYFVSLKFLETISDYNDESGGKNDRRRTKRTD